MQSGYAMTLCCIPLLLNVVEHGASLMTLLLLSGSMRHAIRHTFLI